MLSQEKLAELLGVSRQAVSKWETGLSNPDTKNLMELARVFNVTMDELVEEVSEDNEFFEDLRGTKRYGFKKGNRKKELLISKTILVHSLVFLHL